MNQKIFYKDIIDVLDDHVQKIVKERWKNDKCPPIFTLSLDNEKEDNQKILITIYHLGRRFTRTLFPRYNSYYGYDSIADFIETMYNQTM